MFRAPHTGLGGCSVSASHLSCGELRTSIHTVGLPRWLSDKQSTCQRRSCRSCGFDQWVGKILWRRKRPPTQHSCLENLMDGRAWWAIVHNIAKRRMGPKRPNTHTVALCLLPSRHPEPQDSPSAEDGTSAECTPGVSGLWPWKWHTAFLCTFCWQGAVTWPLPAREVGDEMCNPSSGLQAAAFQWRHCT